MKMGRLLARVLVLACLGAVLGGCATVGPLFGMTPPNEAAPGTYPDLAAIPPAPEQETDPEARRAVVEGLVADRANARYTSEVLQAVPVAPQQPAQAVPVPAQDPAPAPAPARSDRSAVPELEPPARVAAQPPPMQSAAAVVEPASFGAVPKAFPALPPLAAAGSAAIAGGVLAPAAAVQVNWAALGPAAALTRQRHWNLSLADGSGPLSPDALRAVRAAASAHLARGGTLRVVGLAQPGRGLDASAEDMIGALTAAMRRAEAVLSELTRLGLDPRTVAVEATASPLPDVAAGAQIFID